MSVEDAVVRLKQLVTTHPELQGVALNLLSVQHKAAVDRLLQEPLVSITQALKSASALVFWMHSNGMPPTQEATTRMLDSAGAVVRSAGRERWQAAAAAAAAAEAASTAAVKVLLCVTLVPCAVCSLPTYNMRTWGKEKNGKRVYGRMRMHECYLYLLWRRCTHGFLY